MQSETTGSVWNLAAAQRGEIVTRIERRWSFGVHEHVETILRSAGDHEQDFHEIVSTLAECVEKCSRSVAR